jgi:urease accessory protein
MNQCYQSSTFVRLGKAGFSVVLAIASLAVTSLLFSTPALAHHAMGGKLPATFFEGFVSGLAHPVIGLDHFTFVVSVGLLAAISRQGIKIPLAFVLAAMLGTGLHLMQLALPAAELVISGSVLLFGILLALKERPNSWILTGLAAFIGLFHGYAYGESIFGAEITPLIAYLVGFTAIQLVVAIATFLIGKTVLKRTMEQPNLLLRFAGFVICGAGAVFLSTLILETIFPA